MPLLLGLEGGSCHAALAHESAAAPAAPAAGDQWSAWLDAAGVAGAGALRAAPRAGDWAAAGGAALEAAHRARFAGPPAGTPPTRRLGAGRPAGRCGAAWVRRAGAGL